MQQTQRNSYRLSLLFVLLQFIFLFPVYAQEQSSINTIRTEGYSSEDSTAIINLIKASQKSIYKNLPKALRTLDSAMQQSRNTNFFYGIGNAYIAYSVCAISTGNYAACDSLLLLAGPYCYLSSKESSSNKLMALWLQNKGNLEAYRGNYNSALSYSFAALKSLEAKSVDSGQYRLRTILYNDIGSMLQYLNRADKAIYYLTLGEKLSRSHNVANYKLASLYVNFSNAYRQKGEWQKSWKYLYQAVDLAKKYQDYYVLQVAYLSFANSFLAKEQPDSAAYWLNKADDLRGTINPYMSRVMPIITLGEVYLKKKDFRKALTYGEKALEQGKALRAPQTVCLAHQLLFKAYSGIGQWREAFFHQNEYYGLNDSLRNAKKEVAINQLEVKYRVARKDQLLTMQAFALNRQVASIREKNYWIAGIAFAFAFLLVLFWLLRRNYLNSRRILEGEVVLSRMKALVEGEEKERERIARDLHDGVVSRLLAIKLNLSNTISKKDDFETLNQSVGMLTEALQDLRGTAHNLSNESFIRRGFSEAVRLFCAEIDSSRAVRVVFQSYGLEEGLKDPVLLSVFRMIQELVQNVIKHAAAQTLLVQLSFQNKVLGVTVQDDGIGFDAKNMVDNMGNGLSNLQERVLSLRGLMEIASDATGTSVYLEFSNILDKGNG